MKFKDLRDFVQQLEQRGELKRIQVPVSPVLEMTEICDRTLRSKGPALLFEKPDRLSIIRCSATCSARPSAWRWAWAPSRSARLREIGKLLAFLKEPEPPKGSKDAWSQAADLPQDHRHGPQSGQGRGVPGSGHRRR